MSFNRLDKGAVSDDFKTNAEFWLELQNFCDLESARLARKASEIARQVRAVGAE